MFYIWLVGLGVISSLILNWPYKKFLNMKPTLDDIVILTLFLFGATSLIKDLIKAQDPFVSTISTLIALILAFHRYKDIKKILNQANVDL